MKAVFIKEFKSFFNNLSGYVFCTFMLLFSGIYTMVVNLKSGYPNFEYVLSNMTFVFLIAVPLLTMKIVSEDKKQKTDQLYYSLPLSTAEVVLGKYAAMLCVLAIPILIMALYPLILTSFGPVSLLRAYSALLAFFLLGGALISIGMFISSLTESQATSAVVCLIVLLLNFFLSSLSTYVSASAGASFAAMTAVILIIGAIVYYMTKNLTVASLFGAAGLFLLIFLKETFPEKFAGFFPALMNELSVFDRFNSFISGIFDLTSVVYFIMVSVVFVFLTVQSMEKRRWS